MFCKRLIIVSVTTALSLVLQSDAHIRFGSKESAITLLNTSTLHCIKELVNKEGTIHQRDTSSIVGEDIIFRNGVYEEGRSDAVVTANHVADASGTGTIRLNGSASNPKKLRGNSGMTIEQLTVKGNYNRLEGFPTFANPIQLEDETTTLTIAIHSALNKNIELNGGTIILEDDLALADGVSLTGPGTISLNGRRLKFGSEDLDYTSSLYWKGAADVYLNGKIDLSGSWTFEGDCYLNGHSMVLNLVNFGSLTIQENSRLFVKQIKLEGLGSEQPEHGKIYFADGKDISSSKLHFRRAALELTSTYTFDTGHVIIETGASDAIVKNHFLYFENDPADKNNPPSAHLTVKDVVLYYKTRIHEDYLNIRPLPYSREPFPSPSSPIQIEKTGDIVHHQTFQSFQEVTIANIGVGGVSNLFGTQFPGKGRPLGRNTASRFGSSLSYNKISFGSGNTVNLSREPNIFQLYYYDRGDESLGIPVSYTPPEPIRHYFYNTGFRGLHPRHIFYAHEDLQFVFADGITFELKDDIALVPGNATTMVEIHPPIGQHGSTFFVQLDGTNSPTWIFQGNAEINGNGKTIDMEQGEIIVENLEFSRQDLYKNPLPSTSREIPSTLKLYDLTLANVKNGSLKITSTTSKILFKDVKIFLTEDFYFDRGTFEVEGNLEVYSATGTAPVHFIYATDSTTSSTIRSGAMLHFDRNVTFSYAPHSSFNTLIEFEDRSSVLSLKGATLYSSTVGLHLTKGTLLVDHNCTLSNHAADLSQALILGDNTNAESELAIEVMPGGNIDIQGGIVEYREIST